MDRDSAHLDTDYQKFLMGVDNLQRKNDGAEDNDPQYIIFLNSLMSEGNSWVVQADEANAFLESYIMEDVSHDPLDQYIKSPRRNMIGENIEDVLSNCSGPEGVGSLSENQRKTMVENGMKFDLLDPLNTNTLEVGQCLDEERDTAVSSASDEQGGSAENCNSKRVRTSGKVTKIGQSEANDVDYDYLSFLTIYPDAKNGPMVTDGDSDLYVHMDNGTWSMKGNPKSRAHIAIFDVDGDDSCAYLGSPSGEINSPFREQLMRVLRKPFDRKELHMLADRLKERKPIERNLDLRNGRERSYVTNKDGKSLLDHYPDLRRKLEAADCQKELSLLRGFFFWIQNLTREEAFKPWLDKSCLDFRPED